MSKDNGGPAFPRDGYQIEDEYGRKETIQGKNGMTLRDYFAAKAMQSLAGKHAAKCVVIEAYEIADLMLLERAK